MIKLFRNIRRQLLNEGKTARYFKYALGEIVLVVIGILIALGLNNLNEESKNNDKKVKLLKALEIEYTANLNQLDTVLYYDNLVLKGTLRLLKLEPENPVFTVSDSMPLWIQNSSYRWTFDPINGALRSGISSGEIHLIKNDSLVNLLFGWQDVVADARENEDRAITTVESSFPILEKYVRRIDYRNVWSPELGKSRFPSDYKSLLKDPLFEDYLGERYISMIDAFYELKTVKKQNILILKLIEKELTK